MTEFGLPEKPGYTRADLLGLLGCSTWKLVEQMKTGIVPRPAGKDRGKPAWTLEQVRAVLVGMVPVERSPLHHMSRESRMSSVTRTHDLRKRIRPNHHK